MNDVLCVDIGGTSAKAGVLSASGDIGETDSIPSRPDVESFFGQLVSLIDERRGSCRQIGVAVAGFLDERRTKLVYNSNLSWLEGFPLRDRLLERFPGFAIELEVDSNAATMAEYQLGSGRGSRRFLCVTAGTGLGVGLAVDGNPVRFAYGCLGDIGHVIVHPDGPLCTCGGHGCAEILISAPVLAENYARRVDRGSLGITLRNVIEAAQGGDVAAIEVLREAGESLGIAIASMANIFFPDHIALAGGLSAAGTFVLEPAERVFRRSACLLARSEATFTVATLGSLATLIGAAWPFWSETHGKAVA